MAFSERDGVRYFTFGDFPETIVHAVFTRQGGVSPEPWDSLNVGGTVGDDPVRVRENRRRAFAALGRAPGSIFDVWQVHSANVAFGDAPRDPVASHQKADIILTDRPEVTLFMRFADCVPILLLDARLGVVGLAHAGWMGTVRGVATAAVEAMQARYGSRPADIQAAIGPSIGPDHYEVGPDVVGQVKQSFGKDADGLLCANGRVSFDLWSANQLLLERAGVEHVEIARVCTACHQEDWYSHRGEHGKTGRFGALIALKA
ncbi:MAG: peptidoglycan editing factor PgeF [Chloroflexi bacterium]|nr:peptidoglycan editing factor PgeF [Chloroflexota bacterium]